MRLLTIGDSFTYGEELADLTKAWPNLLAVEIGAELTNLAVPGTGNTSMVRAVVENAADYDLIIVAWSHWGRIEFADEYGVFDTWPGHRGLKFTGDVKFRHGLLEYITMYHSDEYLCNQQLMNIVLVQQYLKSLDKKYLLLTTFGRCTDATTHKSLSQVDNTYFLGWPNETMMEWTYGCPQGPGGHFLEEGHKRVADKLYEHIRHLSWIS